jgi:uncharacterized protein
MIPRHAQLDEFHDFIVRPHLLRCFKPGVVQDFVRLIGAVAIIVDEPLPVVPDSPDPDDNLILATALAGSVNLIVSGDKRHLLTLGRFRGIDIVTATEAVARVPTA